MERAARRLQIRGAVQLQSGLEAWVTGPGPRALTRPKTSQPKPARSAIRAAPRMSEDSSQYRADAGAAEAARCTNRRETRAPLQGLEGERHERAAQGSSTTRSRRSTARIQAAESLPRVGARLVSRVGQGRQPARRLDAQCARKVESLQFGSEAWLQAEDIGSQEVCKCAFVLDAGGLGERLGYSRITVELPTETASATKCARVLRQDVNALDDRLPLAIMGRRYGGHD